jgi:hypothetical protein
VPIHLNLSDYHLENQLKNLNGVYIPGDSENLVWNENGSPTQFTKTVQRILMWAQTHNEQAESHFPVLGVGYGALSMLRS